MITPLGVLDQFLTSAAVRNERAIAIVRIVVSAALLLHTVVFGETGIPRWWTSMSVTSAAMVFSIWQLATINSSNRVLPRLFVSVLADSVLVVTAILAWAIWPDAQYVGVLSRVETPILLVAMIASGVRLSRRVAVLGASLIFVLGIVIVWVDYARNADLIAYAGVETLVYAAIAIGAGLMGYFIAARTKQLVYEGADASVKAERARQRLGVYVSEELASDLIESAELAMGGVRQPVAVLFSDLRGFTKYAENISPERLVSELNDYLQVMVDVIHAEGGFVDKFIGDAIMAVFSVPVPRDDDAARALRAAAAMHRALGVHNKHRSARGLPELRQGIGVHYGSAVVGNIGTDRKAQFTVMGDVVNVASRLESATKTEGVAVLASESVIDAARTNDLVLPDFESHGRLAVRGRDGDLEVFTIG